jgi:hypothetical protein
VKLVGRRNVEKVRHEAFSSVPAVPSVLETLTSDREPGGRDGVVALIDVELLTTTLSAGKPPIVTVAPAAKSVPTG